MSWASYLTQFGSGLLVFPLLLKVYSDEVKSFWFLTETISGLALMADMGFGSALTRAASYFKAGANFLPRNKKEYDNATAPENPEINFGKLKDLLTTSFTIYYFLTGLCILLLCTLGTLLIKNVIFLAGNPVDLWIGFFLLIPYCGIAINGVKWRSFIRGLDFIAVEARFSTIIGAVKVIIFIILLSFSLSPAYLIGCLLLLEIIRFYYIKSFVLNWFSKYNVKFENKRYFEKSIFDSLWSASWRLGGIFWGNYFVEQGNSLIISQIKNSSLMASFLITTKILTYIKQFSQITLYSKIPTVYELSAQKKMKELKILASGYMFIGLFIMTSATIVLALFGNWALSLFSDNKLVPLALLIIMGLTNLLDMHASYHAGIYTSTNHIPFLWPTIISGAVIFIIGYFLLPGYGIVGLVMLRFLVQLAFNNWYAVVLSLKLLKWPFRNYIYELPLFGSRFTYDKIRSFIVR
jgi:O-antigen/teichoic acid export membrane protein